MHHRNRLMTLVLALASLPAIAASQPQVPTPTGHLGGRVSADETPSVAVVATQATMPPATPTASDVPGPADCDVAPRERDIAELTGTPAANLVSPEETRQHVPSRTLDELPSGQPVDEATGRAINRTVRQLVACANARQPLAFEALHTDDYFRRAATIEVRREESEGLAEGTLGVSETTSVRYSVVSFPPNSAMPEVEDLRVLPDGRIGAVVRAPGVSPIFFVFAREQPGGPYLVDEAIRIEEYAGTPGA
ncbi:MAG TPA: hypothetical protein VGR16_11295 [Thermomicrobiales bacterium]|nr:hypothetical protein [Thermomicrobiales bacterium]